MKSKVSSVSEAITLQDAYLLARLSKPMFRLFKSDASHYVRDFLTAAIRGDEDSVLTMLKESPSLMLERGHAEKGHVTDYSGRRYSALTAFQLTLCAGDDVMAKKMKAIYLVANPTHGQAILDAQFNEIFPNGYATHLEKQKQDADQFEREVLNLLVDTFTAASPADLQAALNKQDNGSELCQKLKAFKEAFNALSHGEKIYNPQHLQKVLEKYYEKSDTWYVSCDNPNPKLRLYLFWRQVIGWEQRYMPANYAQSFCTGLNEMLNGNLPLQRILNFRDIDKGRAINFFPLNADSSTRLGDDFALFSYIGPGRSSDCGGAPGSLMSYVLAKFISSKNSTLSNITRRESNHPATLRCLVQ